MLQDRLRSLTVVDLRQQAPPRTDARFQHHGVAHCLDGLQSRLRGKGHHSMWYRYVVLEERLRGEEFIPTDACHIGSVDGGDTPIIEHLQRIERSRVVDRAFENHVVLLIGAGIVQVKNQGTIVQLLVRDTAGGERLEQELFLDTDARAQHTHAHTLSYSPQSSSSSGASANSSGSSLITSSSAPHSSHTIISPSSKSRSVSITAPHSEHSAMVLPSFNTLTDEYPVLSQLVSKPMTVCDPPQATPWLCNPTRCLLKMQASRLRKGLPPLRPMIFATGR